MSKINGSYPELLDAVQSALGLDPSAVSRIIIDIVPRGADVVKVYVELLGEAQVPEILLALRGAEIIKLDATPRPAPAGNETDLVVGRWLRAQGVDPTPTAISRARILLACRRLA